MGEGEDGQSKEDAICAVLEQGPLPELIVFDLGECYDLWEGKERGGEQDGGWKQPGVGWGW